MYRRLSASYNFVSLSGPNTSLADAEALSKGYVHKMTAFFLEKFGFKADVRFVYFMKFKVTFPDLSVLTPDPHSAMDGPFDALDLAVLCEKVGPVILSDRHQAVFDCAKCSVDVSSPQRLHDQRILVATMSAVLQDSSNEEPRGIHVWVGPYWRRRMYLSLVAAAHTAKLYGMEILHIIARGGWKGTSIDVVFRVDDPNIKTPGMAADELAKVFFKRPISHPDLPLLTGIPSLHLRCLHSWHKKHQLFAFVDEGPASFGAVHDDVSEVLKAQPRPLPDDLIQEMEGMSDFELDKLFRIDDTFHACLKFNVSTVSRMGGKDTLYTFDEQEQQEQEAAPRETSSPKRPRDTDELPIENESSSKKAKTDL